MIRNFLLVAAGGALGSVLRYGASVLGLWLVGPRLPAATLAVNVIGCGIAGFLLPSFAAPPAPQDGRLFLMVGALGGLTTFSAFSVETVALYADGRAGAAAANIVLNVLLSLLAAWAGYALALR